MKGKKDKIAAATAAAILAAACLPLTACAGARRGVVALAEDVEAHYAQVETNAAKIAALESEVAETATALQANIDSLAGATAEVLSRKASLVATLTNDWWTCKNSPYMGNWEDCVLLPSYVSNGVALAYTYNPDLVDYPNAEPYLRLAWTNDCWVFEVLHGFLAETMESSSVADKDALELQFFSEKLHFAIRLTYGGFIDNPVVYSNDLESVRHRCASVAISATNYTDAATNAVAEAVARSKADAIKTVSKENYIWGCNWDGVVLTWKEWVDAGAWAESDLLKHNPNGGWFSADFSRALVRIEVGSKWIYREANGLEISASISDDADYLSGEGGLTFTRVAFMDDVSYPVVYSDELAALEARVTALEAAAKSDAGTEGESK